MAAGALGCAMFYGAAFAQEAAPAGGVEGVEMGKGVPTVAALFMTSPYINGTLLGLSVIAMLLFLFMLLSLTSASFNPPRFVDNVTKLILNRQFDQAVHLCQSNSGVFSSSIIQRVIENRDKEHGELMEILSAEGRRRGETIWNRVSYLSEISNIAPMLGLLGTVVGMIKVFFTLTERIAGPNVDKLSAGIAEAMGTTMFGLIVAIAAGVFYTLARSRAVRVLAEAEQVCHTIVDHTHRSASDPRLKKIDALADAARKKLHTRSVGPSASGTPSGGGGEA
jgi:biopolymer transport protein ExbB